MLFYHFDLKWWAYGDNDLSQIAGKMGDAIRYLENMDRSYYGQVRPRWEWSKVSTENGAFFMYTYSDPLMARLIKKAGTSMVALGDIGDSLGNRVRPRCQDLVSQDLPPAPHPCSKPLVVLVIVVIVIAMIIVICTLCSFPRSSSNFPISRPTSYYIRSSSSTPMFQTTSFTL